jgi:hypothetical protein
MEIAISKEMLIYAGSINRDHVHSADWDSTTALGIKGGAVSKGKEFTSDAIGFQAIKEAVLGSALMGKRVLGSDEWKCDNRESKATRAR